MKAEMVSVGTELLLGQILNTNAQFLSLELAELGINVYRQTTVGDNPHRLRETLKEALDRADVVITTGGLGPTEDDITKQCAAEVLECSMSMDPEVMARIEEKYRAYGSEVTPNVRSQAMIPEGATVIPNERGTAPGVIITSCTQEAPEGSIICLPGPTKELTGMWESTVRPWLRNRTGSSERLYSRVLKICGMGESSVEDAIQEIIDRQDDPTVAPYAKDGEVHVRLTTRVSSDVEGEQTVGPVEQSIRDILGNYVYGTGEDTLEQTVGELLRDRGLTLGTAESCTGGLVADRITDAPGSSDYFLFGLVAYAEAVKESSLGVSRDLIDREGAVSEPVARAMAEGVRKTGKVRLGLSTTGFAGPEGGTEETPVGTVYIGLAGPEGTKVHHLGLRGNRRTIKERSAALALGRLRMDILEHGLV